MSGRKVLLPYRVLTSETVHADLWSVAVDDSDTQQIHHGDPIAVWDAQRKIKCSRTISLLADASECLGLVVIPEHKLTVTVTGTTAGGVSREVLFQGVLDYHTGATCEVVFEVEGSRLAKELILEVSICLSESIESEDLLCPTIEGSRVWIDRILIQLENGRARLTMWEGPFKTMFRGKKIDHSEYHIEIHDDLDVSVEQGLTVYINNDRPEFVAELKDRGRSGSSAERRLHGAIIRRVLAHTILNHSFVSGQYETGTLAATIQDWISYIWPGKTVPEISGLIANNFSEFDAQVDAWLNSPAISDKPRTEL